VRHIGALLRVDIDKAAFINRDTGPFSINLFAVWTAPNRQQNAIKDIACRSFAAIKLDLQTSVFAENFRDLTADEDVLEFFFEAFFKRSDQVSIAAGHESIRQFNYRNLTAQSRIDAAHFQADDSTADDQKSLWNIGQFERSGGVHEALVLIGKSGNANAL